MKWVDGLLVLAALCIAGVIATIGYEYGKTAGRQAVEAVACEAKQDSVIVHPVRQPRGRVK